MNNPRSSFQLAKFISTELKSGKSKNLLSKTLSLSLAYINKHLWLNTWPIDLVNICELHPDIFTPRVIFNVFASRKKHYSKNDFENLQKEIAHFIEQGAKHKPRKALNYPKSRAGGSLQMQRIRQKANKKTAGEKRGVEVENMDFVNLLYYQQIFQDLIGMHVVVHYLNKNKAGEVRINFKNERDLEYLIEKMR